MVLYEESRKSATRLFFKNTESAASCLVKGLASHKFDCLNWQLVQLLVQFNSEPPQNSVFGLPNGLLGHAKRFSNFGCWPASNNHLEKSFPGLLFKLRPDDLQRPVQYSRISIKVCSAIVGLVRCSDHLQSSLVTICAADGAWVPYRFAMVIRQFVACDAPQPTAKRTGIAFASEGFNPTCNSPEYFLDHIGGVAILQTGPATPVVDHGVVQSRQSVPGLLVKLAQATNQADGC